MAEPDRAWSTGSRAERATPQARIDHGAPVGPQSGPATSRPLGPASDSVRGDERWSIGQKRLWHAEAAYVAGMVEANVLIDLKIAGVTEFGLREGSLAILQ